MKRFKSEFAHSYKTYSFGYSEYAELEYDTEVTEAYAMGFLPYSGTPDIKQTLYMARSARLDLNRFSLNSENRRITKRFDEKLTKTIAALEDFDYYDETFLSFCLDYFAKRHGPDVMPRQRLLTILESGFPLQIITYRNGDENVVGYAFEVSSDAMGHYWYSFYDLSYAYKSLGMWIMLDCIRAAQESGKAHYYLGTVYGEKALYKTNFDALQWWDGNTWNTDTKLLRARSRDDEHHLVDGVDQWKEDLRKF